MRRVVIDMQNYLFADAIASALKNADSDFDVRRSEKPEKTADLCGLCMPVLIVVVLAVRRLARRVLQAIKDGLIDNFIFGSVSAEYLTAVVDTL